MSAYSFATTPFAPMKINCPACGKAILISDEDMRARDRLGAFPSMECPSCQQHFKVDESELLDESEPAETTPPIPVERAKGGEKTFLQCSDVLITDKRVVLNGRTYALKQITAVGRTVDHRGPKLIFGKPAWLACFASFFPLVFIVGFTYLLFDSPIFDKYVVRLIFGLLNWGTLLLPPVVITYALMKSGQIRHWVEIGSASGKEKALLCNTQVDAQRISDAINDAIIDN